MSIYERRKYLNLMAGRYLEAGRSAQGRQSSRQFEREMTEPRILELLDRVQSGPFRPDVQRTDAGPAGKVNTA